MQFFRKKNAMTFSEKKNASEARDLSSQAVQSAGGVSVICITNRS